MINDKEKKQIQRYCIYPKIALVALFFAFVQCMIILPLEMMDDLVFHHKGYQPAGFFTALGFVAVYLIVFCYCALRPKFGMRGKQWKELQNKLNVGQTDTDYSAQVARTLAMQGSGRLLKKSDNETAKHIGGALEVAGAVSAVSTAADVLSETAVNAEAMASAYGVSVPNTKKQLIAFAILPILIVIGVYIPQYMQGSQEMQKNISSAAEQIRVVKKALSPICEYVYLDDPNESYRDSGYHVIGNLREPGPGVQASYVYINFDESGVITDVSYLEEIDVNASLEDNLNQIERDFEALQAPLENLNVLTLNPELLALHTLPDRFKEAFLTGTIYESIRIYEGDAPVRISYSFDTEAEEDFDEYSRPAIRLWLKGKYKS